MVWTCGVSGQVDKADFRTYAGFWPSVDQVFHLKNIPMAELAEDLLGISDQSQLLAL